MCVLCVRTFVTYLTQIWHRLKNHLCSVVNCTWELVGSREGWRGLVPSTIITTHVSQEFIHYILCSLDCIECVFKILYHTHLCRQFFKRARGFCTLFVHYFCTFAITDNITQSTCG